MGFLKPHYQAPPDAPAAAPVAPTLNAPVTSNPVGANSPIGLSRGTSSTIATSPQGVSTPAAQDQRPQLNAPQGPSTASATQNGTISAGNSGAATSNPAAMMGLPGMTIITPQSTDMTQPQSLTIKSLLGGT